jgi:uncharacterized protein (TIGR02453 family)
VSFRGWPPAALEFYEGLEADNSKSYWLAHKDVYERDVRAPMEALLDELTDEFGDVRLLRPYRDIRFSPDKSPYRTSIGAMVGAGYVQLSARGLFAGAGSYHLEGGQLDRYRRAVDSEASGPELEGVVAVLRRARVDVHGTDPLKTAPQGYAKDHPRIELLRFKGIVATKAWPAAAWLGTPEAGRRVAGLFRTAAPLVDWLSRNVGPGGRH